MSDKLKIGVILSSTRKGRMAEVVHDWFALKTRERDDMAFGLLDLREANLPFFDEDAPPAAKTPEHAAARAWEEAIQGYDGFIVLTCEYNHSISAALKNAFDYGYRGWVRKPLGAVGYGGVGAARAVEHLRLIGVNFGMVPVAGAVHIGGADFMTLSKTRDPQSLGDHLDKSLGALLDDIAWWGKITKAARG